MWEWVAVLTAAVGTPWAIVAFIARSIIRGDLVSRRVHEDRVADVRTDAAQAIAALTRALDERDRQVAILVDGRDEVVAEVGRRRRGRREARAGGRGAGTPGPVGATEGS